MKTGAHRLKPVPRQSSVADAQIDDLVYELYAINTEERKIIEAQP